VTDEAGNSITVRYDELTITSGDYHITELSPAVDRRRRVMPIPTRSAVMTWTETSVPRTPVMMRRR